LALCVLASPAFAQANKGGNGPPGNNNPPGKNNPPGNGTTPGNPGNNNPINLAATPELSSLMLLGGGLSGAAGYIVLRVRANRRRELAND
jgi:hypothetical protein